MATTGIACGAPYGGKRIQRFQNVQRQALCTGSVGQALEIDPFAQLGLVQSSVVVLISARARRVQHEGVFTAGVQVFLGIKARDDEAHGIVLSRVYRRDNIGEVPFWTRGGKNVGNG
jgi:hypothetical protein